MNNRLIGLFGVIITFVLSKLLDYLIEQYPGLPDFPHRNEILIGSGVLIMVILIALDISGNNRLKKINEIVGPEASDIGKDYTSLALMLSQKDFEAADKETAKIMLWAAQREKQGWLREEDINKFPCRDLHTIDQLWLASSGGKFGFSVQKQIWIECGGKLGIKHDFEADFETMLKFLERLEWRVDGEESFVNYDNLRWDLRAPKGHLPTRGLIPKRKREDEEEWDGNPKTGRSFFRLASTISTVSEYAARWGIVDYPTYGNPWSKLDGQLVLLFFRVAACKL